MTRDEQIAHDLGEAHNAVYLLEGRVESCVNEAMATNAFAHRDLYEETLTKLVTARVALRGAADLMNPEVTDVFEFANE